MKKPLFWVLLLFTFASINAFGQSPVLFFTDLTSAPAVGGESVAGFSGAYVTLYGNALGASPTVTLNGAQCVRVVSGPTAYLWYQRMTVQLGSSCATGNFVVSTTGGTSNGLPFAVRGGNIRFVSTSGTDGSAGTFSSPWRTIAHCKDTISPGDICYVENGGSATGVDNYSASIVLGTQCSATLPCALVTYPGASSTIGNSSQMRGLLSCSGLSGCSNGVYWTVAGFSLTSNLMAADIQTDHIRLVGNTLSCPNVGSGSQQGCLQTENAAATDEIILGNDTSTGGNGGKQYHAMYFGADGHTYDIGWNRVHDVVGACRGMQWFNGSGNTYNINVHDNLLYNIPCNAINLASVDASMGYVNAYNNVIYHAGAGPSDGDEACIEVSGASASQNVEVFNNTLYDCGAGNNGADGGFNISVNVRLRNNIIYVLSGESYFEGGHTAGVTGSNNIWYGGGTGPSVTTGNINQDPQFVSTASKDFHLQSGSPAIDAGVNIPGLTSDVNGVFRPQGTTYDIGASEFRTGTVASGPTPPSSLTAVVN
jgi:hypothetical protein